MHTNSHFCTLIHEDFSLSFVQIKTVLTLTVLCVVSIASTYYRSLNEFKWTEPHIISRLKKKKWEVVRHGHNVKSLATKFTVGWFSLRLSLLLGNNCRNCLENVRRPISEKIYSMRELYNKFPNILRFIQFAFLLLRFSWDFRFCFPCAQNTLISMAATFLQFQSFLVFVLYGTLLVPLRTRFVSRQPKTNALFVLNGREFRWWMNLTKENRVSSVNSCWIRFNLVMPLVSGRSGEYDYWLVSSTPCMWFAKKNWRFFFFIPLNCLIWISSHLNWWSVE